MSWPLMSGEEIHAFGIKSILNVLQTEGLVVESVNSDIHANPQIVGWRWGELCYIFVRTACYPAVGQLSDKEMARCIDLAVKHHASAMLAPVGIACMTYPNRKPVVNEGDVGLPIKGGGFSVTFEGLVRMTYPVKVRR